MPCLLITAGVFIFDFFIKRFVDKKYACGETYPKCRNKIIIEKYYNKGAAMNFLAKKPEIMRGLHTVVLLFVGMGYYLLLRMKGKPLCKAGTSLLLGGGLSNLYDRYTKEHVVDYFHINLGPKWMRGIIFNISDFCIFIGALLSLAGSEQT